MIITNSIDDFYVIEENNSNSINEDKFLLIGSYKNKSYKTLIDIDISKIIDNRFDDNISKIELGLFVKDIKIYNNKKMVINIKESETEESYRYIVNSNCLNKYLYFDITDLVNTLINKVHTCSEITLSTNCNSIKFYSSRAKEKPIIRITEKQISLDNKTKREEYESNYSEKNDECIVEDESIIKNSTTFNINEKKIINNKYKYEPFIDIKCFKKVYGNFYNTSGVLKCINNINYIKWDFQETNGEIDKLNDNLTIKIKYKGAYFVSFMINSRSDTFTTMQLLLNGKKIINSEFQIGLNEGISYGQLVLNVEEENSLLNLVINDTNSILINIGVSASIIIYNL
ncbi:hypothetical protein [Clostridium sp.]|uniref:hypothetical protein n=1 Tax=Clostridium sp. TaxID=1506 RepID=UPI003F377938